MTDEPIFRAPMRGFEAQSLILELPLFAASLAAGCVAGGLYAWIVVYHLDELPMWAPLALLGLFAVAGMVFIFWGASYFAREVAVTAEGVKFRMLFSSRTLDLDQIASAETLDFEATRKTFLDFSYRNLTPAVNGAVVIRPFSGRAWLFNLDDPEAFIRALLRVKPALADDREARPHDDEVSPGPDEDPAPAG